MILHQRHGVVDLIAMVESTGETMRRAADPQTRLKVFASGNRALHGAGSPDYPCRLHQAARLRIETLRRSWRRMRAQRQARKCEVETKVKGRDAWLANAV